MVQSGPVEFGGKGRSKCDSDCQDRMDDGRVEDTEQFQ